MSDKNAAKELLLLKRKIKYLNKSVTKDVEVTVEKVNFIVDCLSI